MEIEIIRTNRKTIAVKITRDGCVQVRAPRILSEREIRRFVDEKSGWIEKHLTQTRSEPAGKPFTGAELRSMADQALAELLFAIRYLAGAAVLLREI